MTVENAGTGGTGRRRGAPYGERRWGRESREKCEGMPHDSAGGDGLSRTPVPGTAENVFPEDYRTTSIHPCERSVRACWMGEAAEAALNASMAELTVQEL